jgi:glycosyltransferase involved in cell wall biosynthesis
MSGSWRIGQESSLRVAIVSTKAGWHGGELQAALLADGLHARGHRALVLARNDSVLAHQMTARGIPVRTFAGRGRQPLALWQIRRQLARFQPQILHFNDPHAVQSAGVASWGLPIRLRVASRRVDFPLRSSAMYRWFCDGVICVSHAVQQICASAGLSVDRLPVVHDGVDPVRTRLGDRQRGRATLGLDTAEPLLLTIAKLTDHKGHRDLLDALPTVLRRFPRTVLACAGDGPLRAVLSDQAHRLGIADRVRFLGFCTEIPDLLAAADLLVVPSRLEGLCSSIIDAMFHGCPIVATRAGGIPDLLEARNSEPSAVGWLVPPEDPAALAAALLEGLASPEKCCALAQRAKDRAWREFTAATMVEQTLSAYQELIRVTRPQGATARTTFATGALVSRMNRSRSTC